MSDDHQRERIPHYLLQFFGYDHLPEHLRAVSEPFSVLAYTIARVLPDNPERTTALRKLLEAKDCAVRAKLYEDPQPRPPQQRTERYHETIGCGEHPRR